MWRCNKARFLYTLKKLRLKESLLLELYQFGGGGGGRGAGCLFEARRLLHVPFSAFRIGAQVGLIWGWLIQINTVYEDIDNNDR